MDRPETKAALLDRVRRERAAWERLLAEVGERGWRSPGRWASGPSRTSWPI